MALHDLRQVAKDPRITRLVPPVQTIRLSVTQVVRAERVLYNCLSVCVFISKPKGNLYLNYFPAWAFGGGWGSV